VVDDRRLSFAKSSITGGERRAALDVLDSGWLTKSPEPAIADLVAALEPPRIPVVEDAS
jgi:hypothetical protein